MQEIVGERFVLGGERTWSCEHCGKNRRKCNNQKKRITKVWLFQHGNRNKAKQKQRAWIVAEREKVLTFFFCDFTGVYEGGNCFCTYRKTGEQADDNRIATIGRTTKNRYKNRCQTVC